MITSGWNTFAIDLIPFDTISGVNTVADTTAGINYQGDNQHLNDAGNNVIAPTVISVLSAHC